MRYLVVGLVCLSQIASAEEADYLKPWEQENKAGLFLQIDAGWERLHPPTGLTYQTQYVRIAPAISLNHFLYLGMAMQLGRIYSASGTNTLAAAIPANDFTDESNGSTLAGQVFLGARDLIGIFGIGGEVAPTVRETSAGMNFEYTADKTYLTTIEIHGRVDVWATPYLSAGIIVGMDIASIHDFQAGLALAFHAEPYDSMVRGH